jgi:hypothetical protein
VAVLSLIHAFAIAVAFYLGYSHAMLPPPGMAETATGLQLICFFLLGVAASIATFLKGTLLPIRALSDIKSELRENPNGTCAPRKLRPSFNLSFAIGIAMIACAAGQFVRRLTGLPAALPEVFLVIGVGWTIGVSFLWRRLNVRSQT